MKYAGETLYMLVNEGEIIDMFADEDEAQAAANGINEGNVDDEVREAGYDPEELTDDDRARFAFAAGYNGGYAYCEAVTIPEEPEEDSCDEDDIDGDYEEGDVATEDTAFYTSEGDEFTYGDVIRAMDDAIAREEVEELEEIDDDM